MCTTHLAAIPLQRAIVLSATLSPRRRHLAGPLTVATLILGSSLVGETAAPSARCHSTLCGVRGRSVDAATLEEEEDGGADARAAELGKDLVDEGDASEHSLCASWTSASAQESAGAKRGRTSLLPHKVASS